ncbi:Hypothetical predicted protein [Mytilus galloprovincialis]|uniref:Uncharacterized protein n=1 Tax=Mytilus galloprovincialis TaxID=29158 RepID=A0A8B6C6Y2_MYTGA|nr:Hypothetical predicted protein [Mytilus galloprovincialis]
MIFKNYFRSQKDIEKNFNIIQNLPTTSNNIYAVPCDSLAEETVTCKIIKDRWKNEDNGVSDQDPVYSEVFKGTNMKYEMSIERTSEPPDIVDHNGDGISADRCHV